MRHYLLTTCLSALDNSVKKVLLPVFIWMVFFYVFVEMVNGFVHQWDSAGFVPFTGKINARSLVIEVNIFHFYVQDFLNSCASVIQKDHQKSIA